MSSRNGGQARGEDKKHSVGREWRYKDMQHLYRMNCACGVYRHFQEYMDIGAAAGNGVSCIDHKLHSKFLYDAVIKSHYNGVLYTSCMCLPQCA